jgi:FAD:protein FMN transferase
MAAAGRVVAVRERQDHHALSTWPTTTADVATSVSEPTVPASWRPVRTGGATVAVAERGALGTTARLAVWPPASIDRALAAVGVVLDLLDLAASRFRQDSEISWVLRGGDASSCSATGSLRRSAWCWPQHGGPEGWCARRFGGALISLGYERDFVAIDPRRRGPPGALAPGARMADGQAGRVPAPAVGRVRLDLCATAKGLGFDRGAGTALGAGGQAAGVLVSLRVTSP